MDASIFQEPVGDYDIEDEYFGDDSGVEAILPVGPFLHNENHQPSGVPSFDEGSENAFEIDLGA